MTAALLALAGLCAVLGAALVTLGWRHVAHVEGRAREQVASAEAMRQVVTERDVLRGEAAMLHAGADADAMQMTQLGRELSAARKDLARAQVAAVVSLPPGAAGAAVDRMLEQRRAEQAAHDAAADRGGAPADPVQPGPATDGPEPAWVGR